MTNTTASLRQRDRVADVSDRALGRAVVLNRLFELLAAVNSPLHRPPIVDFWSEREEEFWRGLHALVPQWDEMIEAFNRDSGMAAAA